MNEGEITIMEGSYMDLQAAKGKLDGIPCEIRSIPNNFKRLKLVIPAIFEFAAREKLNLIGEPKDEKLH